MENRQQERAAETEEKIFEAAMRLAFDGGMEAATVRAICKEAGVSTGAFYHHFSSRRDLIARAFVLFDHRLPVVPQAREDPVAALCAILEGQTAFVAHETKKVIADYYQTLLEQGGGGAISPGRAYYRAVERCAQEALDRGLLRPGPTAAYIADFLIQFVRGRLFDWCLHGQDYDVVVRVREELPLALAGFAAVEKSAGTR